MAPKWAWLLHSLLSGGENDSLDHSKTQIHPAYIMRYKLAVLVMVGLLSSPCLAQSSGCLPADDDAEQLKFYARALVSSTDPERIGLRNTLGLGALDSNKVVPVTDARSCAKVVSGLNLYRQTPSQVRRVHVVAMVRDGFMVFEPAPSGPQPASEWKPVYVLTKTFAVRTFVLAF
jgi:hypothetical protein